MTEEQYQREIEVMDSVVSQQQEPTTVLPNTLPPDQLIAHIRVRTSILFAHRTLEELAPGLLLGTTTERCNFQKGYLAEIADFCDKLEGKE